jgi:uncharacterized protein involved in exopolysaccharide biosynthesis
MNEANIVVSRGEGSLDLSLRDLVTPLFRRRRTIIVTFFSVLAAAIALIVLLGPTYTSRMTILVDRERLEPLVTPESTAQQVTPNMPITEEEINSEVELLLSRDVLEKVVVANGLDQPADGFSLVNLLHPHQTREDRIARAVKYLAKQIKVTAVTRTNLIEVKYSSSDPQRSYGVLKSLGEFYTQKHVEVHRPAGSYEFFVRETQKYHDLLEQAEARLRDFAIHHGVADPDAQETNLAQQVATSVGLMHLAEQNLAADQYRLNDDRQQMSKTPKRAATTQTSAAADKLLDELNANLLALETKRTSLVTKYDPSYPLVQDIDQEIAQTKAAVAEAEKTRYVTESTDLDPTFEAVREDHAKTQADRAAQVATVQATKRSIQAMQAQMVDLDRQSIARQDLVRDVKADEQNYLTYLAKREQERTSDALDRTRIANVAIAVPPAIPVLPILGWPVMVFLCLCFAAIASLGGAYAADYFDPSFHSPEQLTQSLGIPLVIVFPKQLA